MLALSVQPALVHADKIKLKTGREVEGLIIFEDDKNVTVEVSGTKLTLVRSQIESIEKKGAVDNALIQGDALVAAGRYADAMRAYEGARASKPKEAEAKIAAARAAMEKAAAPAADASEADLRARLAAPGLPPEQSARLKAQLAAALMKKADAAVARLDYPLATKCYEEAYALSPDAPDLAVAFAGSLLKTNNSDARIKRILEAAIARDPNNMAAIELYVGHVARTDPWGALKTAYPKGKLHPKASNDLKAMLPPILLSCYHSSNYPIDAPLTRQACWAQYQALKPAISTGGAPTLTVAEEVGAAKKNSKEEAKLLAHLQELSRQEGRDNAMIHYLRMGAMVDTDKLNEKSQLIDTTLLKGWGPEAEPLLPLIASLQPAFQEMRKGAALDNARNAGLFSGVNSPIPTYLVPLLLSRMMAVESLYFETQGKYREALDNCLTIVTMGRDYGRPKNVSIGFIMSHSIEMIGLKRLYGLLQTGHLDQAALERTLARLKAIETTQPAVGNAVRDESESDQLLYKAMREKPNETRALLAELAQFSSGPQLSPDEMIRNVDRLESEEREFVAVVLKHLSVPFWKRDPSAQARELATLKRSQLPRVHLNFYEVEVRSLVVRAKLILVQTAIALDLYKLEHGRYPQGLADLTPKYFRIQPLDPFSGAEFKYAPSADGATYKLYSIGPDRTDDQGAVEFKPGGAKDSTQIQGDVF